MGVILGLIISAIAVALWQWSAWPDRTAREFLSLVADGRFDHANQYLAPPTRWEPRPDDEVALTADENDSCVAPPNVWQWWLMEPQLRFQSRSLLDLVYNRRVFQRPDSHCRFVVTPGAVRLEVQDQLRFSAALAEAKQLHSNVRNLKTRIGHLRQAVDDVANGRVTPNLDREKALTILHSQIRDCEAGLVALQRTLGLEGKEPGTM
jgi:hypothetical protein